jgi:cytochrome d ubiquinol oxidase subunit II
MKTEDDLQAWARKCAGYLLGFVAFFMAVVSISMPLMNERIRLLWFTLPNFFFLKPLPILSLVMMVILWIDLQRKREYRPFLLSLGIFLMNYLGLIISMWPWLVPFELTFRRAAAAVESQSLLLVGTVVLLPVILGYTAYSYYVFRGKSSHETTY